MRATHRAVIGGSRLLVVQLLEIISSGGVATSPSRRKRRRKEGERERKMERKIRENREITNFRGGDFFTRTSWNKLEQVGSSQQVEKGSRGGRGVGGEGGGREGSLCRGREFEERKILPLPCFSVSHKTHARAHSYAYTVSPLYRISISYTCLYITFFLLFFLLHRRIAGRLSCRYNIPRKNFPSSLCTKTP